MKKLLFVWTVCIIALFSLGSCTHYYYAPNQHNVPLFKEKNEVRLSGAFIQGDEVAGCDIQTGYAMTKESAIIANALLINPNAFASTSMPFDPGSSGGGKGQLYELGAGYYKPIPSPFAGISKKFVFETYGVFGLGNSTNYYGNYPSYNISTNLFKAYLQPSIGYTTNLFDVILSAKVGALYIFGIRKNVPDTIYDALVQNGASINNDLNILIHSRTSFLFEPAVTFRVGFKYVKFHFQWGPSFLSSSMRYLTSSPVWDIGLTLAIAHRFWQKDDRPKKEHWKELFE